MGPPVQRPRETGSRGRGVAGGLGAQGAAWVSGREGGRQTGKAMCRAGSGRCGLRATETALSSVPRKPAPQGTGSAGTVATSLALRCAAVVISLDRCAPRGCSFHTSVLS